MGCYACNDGFHCSVARQFALCDFQCQIKIVNPLFLDIGSIQSLQYEARPISAIISSWSASGNPSRTEFAVLESHSELTVKFQEMNRSTQIVNRLFSVFAWFTRWTGSLVDTRFLPCPPASWTSVHHGSKFLHHCWTLLSVVKVVPYALLICRLISAALHPSSCSNRMIVHTKWERLLY